MRNKRSFNKVLNKEISRKQTDQAIIEFIKLFSDKEPIPTSTKIECLTNLLNGIRTTFSISNNDERLKFETELLTNTKTISYHLISCLIQVQSNVIRLLSLRILLYLTHFQKYNQQLQQFNINIYIVRIIDLDFSIDDTSLAIEYIRLIIQLYPNCLDESYLYCLLSSLEDSKFKLNTLILETVLEISTKQPKLAIKCQSFSELINYIVNVCNENEFCIEIIIQTLLKILEKQEYRELIRFQDLFRNLIAPFVDYEYVPLIWGTDFSHHSFQSIQNEPKINEILSSCSHALLSLLNSYSGLMCFCTNDYQLLKDFISPMSWFLKSNKRDFLEKELNQLSASSSFQSFQTSAISSKKLTQIQQIISSQLNVLNYLVDFIYKLFKIDEINTRQIVKKRNQSNKYCPIDLFNEDEFVNSECDSLLESVDDFQLSYDLTENTIISSGPNLSICFKTFLLKTFIEVGLFESLLDLYFGLPVSFLENNFNYSKLNMNSSYQNLSLKCLNLFANLYYLANNLFNNEYCIDNFNELRNLDCGKFYNQGIYTELKKLSLVSYLKKLNDQEREKEVIFYLTEFNTKKESLKNGTSPPIEEISKLSFFSQQFLSNSGFLSSNKFEIELEILNLTNTHQFVQNLISGEPNSLLDIVTSLVDDSKERKEAKKMLLEIEKKLDEQIDATQILQFDTNISSYDSKLVQQESVKHWNWFEIIKLFELYLLTSSPMQPRFSPTQDALVIEANKRLQTDKLIKCLTKLINFYSLNKEILSTINNNSQRTNSIRLSASTQSYTDINDLISCIGCYLIDFSLNQFNLNNLNHFNRSDSSRYFTTFEFNLIQLLQNIKLYLTIEFFPTSLQPERTTSISSQQNRFITKDSLVSYYILFMGHLTASDKGNHLIDSFKLYDLIIRIIETSRDINIMKLIVSTFNYYVSIKTRTILEKCLCLTVVDSAEYSYSDFKIYTLKLIYNIFRACSSKFEAFFIDIILQSVILQLENDSTYLSNQFSMELSLNLVEFFLNHRPDLVSQLYKLNTFNTNKIDLLKKFLNEKQLNNLIKIKIKLILNRLLLHKEAIGTISVEAIQQMATEWNNHKMSVKYYQLIERNVFNLYSINSYFVEEYEDRLSFTTDSEATKTDTKSAERFIKLYRRINDSSKNNSLYSSLKAQIIPVHFNSILIRFKNFIQNNYFINNELETEFLNQIQTILKSASQEVSSKKLKEALWSICSLLNCENGFKYLKVLNTKYKIFSNLFHFTSTLIKIAESNSNLSVRVTGFLCLNLVSKTCTGANLIGKIGWHTFQPNQFMESKAFYSKLSSFNDDEQEDFYYSPIDTAVALYNLNRAKTNLNLNTMSNFDINELSNYEKEFLDEQSKIDLMNKTDNYYIKSKDNLIKIGFFHDNITVPMRQSLMTADHGLFITSNGSSFDSFSRKSIDNDDRDEIKQEILSLINKLTPVVNVEKIRSSLYKLKQQHPDKFDLHLHNLIAKKILSKHKIKFQFRKFIQELFFNLTTNNLL